MRYLPDSLPEPRISSGVGKGWWPIVEQLHTQLLELDPDYVLDQVKEKFGTLRYYFTTSTGATVVHVDVHPVRGRMFHGDDERLRRMEALVAVAEATSAKTCESCGAAGELRRGGWWLTLCDDCQARERPFGEDDEDDG